MQWLYRYGGLIAPLRHEIMNYVQWAAPDVDSNAVKVVLAELLGNVVKHTDSGAVINFECEDGAATLTVVDHGPGYTTDHFELADPFAEQGRGLWIAYQLTSDLRVEAAPHGGTQVTATFPVPAAPPF